MTIEVLDPTYGDDTHEFAPAGRLTSLEGATVGQQDEVDLIHFGAALRL